MDRRQFLNLVAAFGASIYYPVLSGDYNVNIAKGDLPPWAGILVAEKGGFWRLFGFEYHFGMRAPILWLNGTMSEASLEPEQVAALRFVNKLHRSLGIDDEVVHEFDTLSELSQIPEHLFRPIARYYRYLLLIFGASSLVDPRTGYVPDKLKG